MSKRAIFKKIFTLFFVETSKIYIYMFNVNYRTADNLFNKIALATSNATFIPII